MLNLALQFRVPFLQRCAGFAERRFQRGEHCGGLLYSGSRITGRLRHLPAQVCRQRLAALPAPGLDRSAKGGLQPGSAILLDVGHRLLRLLWQREPPQVARQRQVHPDGHSIAVHRQVGHQRLRLQPPRLPEGGRPLTRRFIVRNPQPAFVDQPHRLAAGATGVGHGGVEPAHAQPHTAQEGPHTPIGNAAQHLVHVVEIVLALASQLGAYLKIEGPGRQPAHRVDARPDSPTRVHAIQHVVQVEGGGRGLDHPSIGVCSVKVVARHGVVQFHQRGYCIGQQIWPTDVGECTG